MKKFGLVLGMFIVMFGLVACGESVEELRGMIEDSVIGNLRDENAPVGLGLVSIHQNWEAFDDSVDWDAFDFDDPAAMPNIPTATPEQMREIGQLPYVEIFEYYLTIYAESHAFDYSYSPGWGSFPVPEGETSWLSLRGTTTAELVFMEKNMIELISGRSFTESEIAHYSELNPAIIPSGLAEANGLTVGSTFTVDVIVRYSEPFDDTPMWEWWQSEESIYEERSFSFEVVGIFDMFVEDPFVATESEPWGAWGIENQIYLEVGMIHIPYVVAEKIFNYEMDAFNRMMLSLGDDMPAWFVPSEDTKPLIESLLILSEPADFNAFRQAAMEILPEFWTIEDISDLISN